MTCGINLGILLICFLHAVHVCSSWALQDGEGSRRELPTSPVDLLRVQGRFEGSRPQDEFRQAFVVKSSSIDSGPNQGLYNKLSTHTASQAYPLKYYHGSQTNPKKYNMDTIYGKVPPKHALSQFSSIASGSSVSKPDSSNQHIGVVRTWPGQQEGLRTSQYTYSKPEGHDTKQSLLFQSGSHQPAAWKPHGLASYQKPGLDASTQLTSLNGNGLIPPKEYVQATSGLSRGRKVYPNGGSRKKPYSLPQYQPPISQQFSLYQSRPGSDHNQNSQLASLQTGVKPAPVHLSGLELQNRRLGPGQRFAPTRIHYIPHAFGGHNIKRLGDEQTTTTQRPLRTTTTQGTNKPLTYPAKTYTFPPRHTESFRPRQPGRPQKSKWMRIRSSQLTGAAGVFGQLF